MGRRTWNPAPCTRRKEPATRLQKSKAKAADRSVRSTQPWAAFSTSSDLARRERAALPPPYVRNVEVKLLFHLFFLRFAALQHLDFRHVNGALVGIEMSFHLYMVAFMALEYLGIFDGPGLLVLVCNEGSLVTVYLDRTVDALQRSLSSLIFLRWLLGWIRRKRGHAKDDSVRENDHKQRFHGSTSLTSSSMVPQTWIERDL